MKRATVICIAVFSVLTFSISAPAIARVAEIIKWEQPPDYCSGFDLQSQWDLQDSEPDVIKADDWICPDGLPVTDVHWWGSYYDNEKFAPDGFILNAYANNPMGAGSADDLPGEYLGGLYVPFASANEFDTGLTDLVGEKVYNYSVYFDREDWFWQEQGVKYWLSIVAVTPGVCSTPIWGWHTGIQPEVCGLSSAVTGKVITDASLGEGNPAQWEHIDYNMAFSLTTVPEPATLTLIGIGLVGLLAFRKRRQ